MASQLVFSMASSSPFWSGCPFPSVGNVAFSWPAIGLLALFPRILRHQSVARTNPAHSFNDGTALGTTRGVVSPLRLQRALFEGIALLCAALGQSLRAA